MSVEERARRTSDVDVPLERRPCPACDCLELCIVLDLPHCSRCGWTGRVPVDGGGRA